MINGLGLVNEISIHLIGLVNAYLYIFSELEVDSDHVSLYSVVAL